MASSQNNTAKPHPSSVITQEDDSCDDEIDLRDYFRIILKQKGFIALASILPTSVLAIIILLWPSLYKVTYIYDVGLDAKQYQILLNRFYCEENLDRIITKLKESGPNEYAQKVAEATTDDKYLRKLVNLDILSPYVEAVTTSKAANPEQLPKTQEYKGSLLAMTVAGKPKKDIQKIASIIRDSFENVIPIYTVKQGLNEAIVDFRTKMADIEQGGFALSLELERKKATLAKLKNLEAEDSNKVRANVTLQFSETGVNGTYLSLAYQIQAIESSIINTEENIKANQDWYNYYKGLIGLNERLLEQVKTKASSYYTIQQFHSFLATLASNYESKELIGYLNAYIKRIENMISTNVPLIEDPKIYPIPKGTFKKTLLAFVVLLITATVTSFVAEGIQKDRAQAAKIAS